MFLLPTALLLAGCKGGDSDTDGDTDVTPTDANIVINEFVAANATGLTDETGTAHPDWIELWNAGSAAVDLGDWTLTDDLALPQKWGFDAGQTIEADAYLIIFADADDVDGPLHTSFRLDAEIGEDIGLFDPDVHAVDQLTYGTQADDVSSARMPDGSENWEADATPTPGATNG